jgi:hypothetical protein
MKLKTVMLVVLVCGGLASLGGCASMSSKGDSSAMAGTPTNYVVDSAYMNHVDAVANQEGVKILWVNPPDKPAHN